MHTTNGILATLKNFKKPLSEPMTLQSGFLLFNKLFVVKKLRFLGKFFIMI